MLVYRGSGYLVPVTVFGSSFTANILAVTFGGKGFWEKHAWPFGSSLIVSSVLIVVFDVVLSKKRPRVLVDVETREFVTLDVIHDFFFLGLKWWGLICLIVGVLSIAFGWAPGAGK